MRRFVHLLTAAVVFGMAAQSIHADQAIQPGKRRPPIHDRMGQRPPRPPSNDYHGSKPPRPPSNDRMPLPGRRPTFPQRPGKKALPEQKTPARVWFESTLSQLKSVLAEVRKTICFPQAADITANTK